MFGRSFIHAHWRDLVLLTYAVPDDLVAPSLGDLEIDRWNGQAYVSIVALHFGDARVFGCIDPVIPAIRRFPQWNLRSYVRYEGKPGIVFLKEFVPSRLVTGVVRAVYKENYHAAPVRERHRTDNAGRTVRYTVDYGGRTHALSLQSTATEALPLAPESLDHFAVERYTGYPAGHHGIHFKVEHRPWRHTEWRPTSSASTSACFTGNAGRS